MKGHVHFNLFLSLNNYVCMLLTVCEVYITVVVRGAMEIQNVIFITLLLPVTCSNVSCTSIHKFLVLPFNPCNYYIMQIVEHTEFVEDGNLQLYPFVKPYHKRCIQQKLVSGGKVQYLHPDQLAVPDEYTNVGRFPEKFVVDGYIICVDVSENLSDPQSQQREFLGRLLPAIMSVKKAHIVVAYTKFDIAKESSVTAANEILARCKRQVTIIEVSALEAVNVDVCFLVLAHLVDSKRPRTKIPTFTTAFAHLKERVRKNEGSFQTVLSAKIIDFSLPLSRARALLENEVEFLVLRELRGKERVDRLIKAQLKYLKEGVLKAKITDFIDHLRASLQIFLQKLSLNDTHESCKKAIITHEKFSAYFVENMDWRDDVEFLKQQHVTQVPFSILDEPEGTRVLQEHMDKVCTYIQYIVNYSIDSLSPTGIGWSKS